MTSSLLEIFNLLFSWISYWQNNSKIYVWYLYYLIPISDLDSILLFSWFQIMCLCCHPFLFLIKLQVWIHELQTQFAVWRVIKEVIWHMRWRLLLPKMGYTFLLLRQEDPDIRDHLITWLKWFNEPQSFLEGYFPFFP